MRSIGVDEYTVMKVSLACAMFAVVLRSCPQLPSYFSTSRFDSLSQLSVRSLDIQLEEDGQGRTKLLMADFWPKSGAKIGHEYFCPPLLHRLGRMRACGARAVNFPLVLEQSSESGRLLSIPFTTSVVLVHQSCHVTSAQSST